MNPNYQKALEGTLRGSFTTTVPVTTFYNLLPVDVSVSIVDPYTGDMYPQTSLNANPANNDKNFPISAIQYLNAGCYYIFRCAGTGGLIGVGQTTVAIPNVYVGRAHSLYGSSAPKSNESFVRLTRPNDIGCYPLATEDRPIPPDSGRVVVGVARPEVNGVNNVIVREQFWQRLGQSYSIAPGETRTIDTTHSVGMDRTSSDTNTLAKSVGASLSVGWGPVSASVSAGLNSESTTFQEVSFREETTTFESFTVSNDTVDEIHTYLSWQLTDVITVLNPAQESVASVVSGQSPILIAKQQPPTKIQNSQP